MKQKRADRGDWQRILQKRFIMKYINTATFTGYVTLFCIDAVREPLRVVLGGEEICLADKGYIWLQHFPQNAHYALTTVFEADGELIRWYIDICKRHFLDEKGMLWYEDLYLDLDVAPDGEATLLDVDELDIALSQEKVTALEYELAWREASSLLTTIENDALPLLWSGEEHKEMLLKLV